MKRGIQPGTVASSDASRKIDRSVKNANKELFEEIKTTYPGLSWQRHFKKDQMPGGVGGCQPDGGIWFFNGKPIVSSEAKAQNKSGNAIERWFKNFYLLQRANKDIFYVTFATGEGVAQNGPIWKTLYIAVDGKYNTINESRVSVFLSEEGFEYDFIKSIMKEIVLEAIEKIRKIEKES